MSRLHKAHDTDQSDQDLTDILVAGLHSWFTDTPFSPHRFPKRYHSMIAEQTAIGWQHVFNGHLSSQWRAKQDYYVRRRKIHTLTHTGTGWARRTLTVIWTNFFLVWKARNEAIHGHDAASQHQARLGTIRIEMEALHSYQNQVLACDTNIFLGITRPNSSSIWILLPQLRLKTGSIFGSLLYFPV